MMMMMNLECVVRVEKDVNAVVHCHEDPVAWVVAWVRVPSIHEHYRRSMNIN